MPNNSYTTTGNYTFTVPANVTSINVEMWGGGGGGGGGNAVQAGAGGGGGAFAQLTNYAVTPGANHNITVGNGGNGGAAAANGVNGTITIFRHSNDANAGYAAPGARGARYSNANAAGGTTAASSGNTTYAGGNGAGRNNATVIWAGTGGGGAGSGGAGGAGRNNAVNAAGGAGGTGNNVGGNGGNSVLNTAGNNGGQPGGGGAGGGATNKAGGRGGVGKIVITWADPPAGNNYNAAANVSVGVAPSSSETITNDPYVVATTSGSTSANATYTVTKPTGTADNDILIAMITATRGGGPTNPLLTPPTGWETFVEWWDSESNMGYFLCWKKASSEGTSWDFTFAAAASGERVCVAVRNADYTSRNPFDCSIDGYSAASGTSIVVPSITTVTNNALVLCLVNNSATGTHSASGLSTENLDVDYMAVYSEVITTAGAIGDTTITIPSGSGIAAQIALRSNSASKPSGAALKPGQKAGNTTSGGTSVTCAFPANVTAGSLLVIVTEEWYSGNQDIPTVTDISMSAGTATLGTFSIDKTDDWNYGDTNHLASAVFSVSVASGGSCTIQYNSRPTGAYINIGVAEFTGVDVTASRVRTTITVRTGTDTNFYTSTFNATQGDLVVVGGSWAYSSDYDFYHDDDYYPIYEVPQGTENFSSALYRYTPASGGLTNDQSDWVTSGSDASYLNNGVVYKVSSGASQYSKTAAVTLAMAIGPSEKADFKRTSAVGAGIAIASAEKANFPELSSVGIGMNILSSEKANFPETSAVGIGLAITDSEKADFPETSAVGIGINVVTSENAIFIRSASAGIGIAITSLGSKGANVYVKTASVSMNFQIANSEVASFLETLGVGIGLAISDQEKADFKRTGSVGVGINIADSEKANFPETSAVGLGVAITDSEKANFVESLNVGIGMGILSSEKASFIEAVAVGLGIQVSDSEVANFVKMAPVGLNITPSVAKNVILVRTLAATFNIDIDANFTTNLVKFGLATVGLNVGTVTAEKANFIENLAVGLGMAISDSEKANFIEVSSVGINVQPTDSEKANFNRSANIQMGVAINEQERAIFPETNSVTILITSQTTGQTGAIELAGVTANMAPLVSEIANFLRQLLPNVSIQVVASEKADFRRALNVGIGTQATATEIANFIEQVSGNVAIAPWTNGIKGLAAKLAPVGIGMNIILSRIAILIRNLSVTDNIAVTTSEIASFVRSLGVGIQINTQVSERANFPEVAQVGAQIAPTAFGSTPGQIWATVLAYIGLHPEAVGYHEHALSIVPFRMNKFQVIFLLENVTQFDFIKMRGQFKFEEKSTQFKIQNKSKFTIH